MKYRHVLVGGGGGFRLGRGNVRQILDHFFRVLRFTGAGLARAEYRLVLSIWKKNSKKNFINYNRFIRIIRTDGTRHHQTTSLTRQRGMLTSRGGISP